MLRKADFDKNWDLINGLKKERDELRMQVNELTVLSKTQINYIVKLEKDSGSKIEAF
ncbi:hypothetical protein [Methanobacterium sp. ACI-7]|uniref:hypothetical protein n=1 Tax=unclassified Methanobacterium TaxID=2627676 RepID=UPI0039C4A1E9